MNIKLNQQLAICKTVQPKRENDFTEIYQNIQKPGLVEGFSRHYTPKFEEGERLPPETKLVTVRVEDAIAAASDSLTEIFNVIATKDATNMTAVADVVVDGETLLHAVPAVHLLFLEKRCASMLDFVSKLPVLSTDESWRFNVSTGLFETEPTESFRTKKVESYPIVAPATDKHPAQVVKVTTDDVVGTWRATKFSGAIPESRRKELMRRAEKVQKAVRVAREDANQTEVSTKFASGVLAKYVFAK